MINGHGGNIWAAAERLGRAPDALIDMSSNINPLGPPPGLLEHLAAHLSRIRALPEPDGASACQALGRLLNVAPTRILAGAGTTQFIYTACRALAARRPLILSPAYADYADACRQEGLEPEFFPCRPEDDFAPDLPALEARLADRAAPVDLCFVCAPNNPTGQWTPLARWADVARRHPDTRFILDCSYLPFAEPRLTDSLAVCAGVANVLILWSASKIFAIPGLRAGFLVAAPEMLDRFRRFARPWTLDTLAQEALRFLGGHPERAEDWLTQTHACIRQEAALLRARLEGCAGLRLIPTRTSFILMQLPPGLDAAAVGAACLEQGILVRDCANFQGLDARFLRVSLKDATANARFADILTQLIRHHHKNASQPASP